MTSLLRDARFALRLLRRTPGFTAVAVLTLALGIGATTAIFSAVYGLFFAPLPYRQPDRLVMLWEQINGERRGPSPRNYLAWKQQATAFADINAWGGGPVNLATDDRPENVPAGRATPGFLAMLGYGHPLALGRTFTESEGILGNDKVVILTYRLWQDRFGGDRAIIGRAVRIDDEPHTVIGVLGEGPADHQQSKIWLPLTFTPQQIASGQGSLNVMARLKDDVQLHEANASLRALAAAIEQTRATRRPGFSVSVEPFRNNFVRDSTKRGLWLLLGAVGFLLLIACANVANLLLTRGTTRRREIAIRTAIGASRASVVRQLLVESLAVALAGGVAGALLARVLIDLIVALMPEYTLPSETEIVLSVPVLLFAFAVCAAAGLLAGAAPAWRGSRADVADVIKEGGRSVSSGRDRLRRALIVGEFALALTLLAGGGMAVQALVRLMNTDLGFRPAQQITMELPVSRGKLTGTGEVEAFYRTLLERVRALPGVTAVSLSTGMPVTGVRFGSDVQIEGRPDEPGRGAGGGVNMVTPDYFAAFGLTMRKGRAFDDRDRAGSVPVMTVNETFARAFFPDGNAIGRRVLLAPFALGAGPRGAPVAWEVVGVYADIANDGPGGRIYPEMMVPFWQLPARRTIITVRTGGETAAVVSGVADAVRTLDPTLPVTRVRTIEQVLSASTASDRFYTVFFAAFATVALALAAIGIYGVMSFAVAQRTHEIGLRMALGARRGQVLGQVLREGMATALAGTGLGVVGALFIGRALKGAIYGVDSSDPLTFVVVAALLLLAALIACVVPARRAATVDPMVALRQD